MSGTETNPHEFPWMVGLLEEKKQEYPSCGGSLISDRHILTAAHCFVEGTLYELGTSCATIGLILNLMHRVIRNFAVLSVLVNRSVQGSIMRLKTLSVETVKYAFRFKPKS